MSSRIPLTDTSRPESRGPAGVGAARLRIRRTRQPLHMLRRVKIFVDGERVARVRYGEECVVEVAPGLHHVQARLDISRTRPVPVEVGPGQTVELEQGAAPRGWKWWISPLYLFVPHRYLTLQVVDRERGGGGAP